MYIPIQIEESNIQELFNIIKEHLKTKENITSLEKMNLNSLISFFKSEISWDKDYIDALNNIRNNRNVVHSFKKRKIGGWEKFKYSLKIYCVLLVGLQDMMPSFDDIIENKV